jgi:hypothetical protein
MHEQTTQVYILGKLDSIHHLRMDIPNAVNVQGSPGQEPNGIISQQIARAEVSFHRLLYPLSERSINPDQSTRPL